jgi:hypothetical protein
MTTGEKRSLEGSGAHHPMRMAIAGGGIGGMALALALYDAGFRDVDVYESASRVKELGVGINLLPHATRAASAPGTAGRSSPSTAASCSACSIAPCAHASAPRACTPATTCRASVRMRTARREDVLEAFASFVFEFLDVPALIRGATTIYQYPTVDRVQSEVPGRAGQFANSLPISRSRSSGLTSIAPSILRGTPSTPC